MSAAALATLLPDQAIDLTRADENWNAVATPDGWGRHVMDVLGDSTGAVFEDPVLQHLVWIIPPGGADDWPAAPPLNITLYRAGDRLNVPGLNGSRCGTRWLHPPQADWLFTDADALRQVVEGVVGPLNEAADMAPAQVCRFCTTITRDAAVIEVWESINGLRRISYACQTRWRDTGGSTGHLLDLGKPR
ncbi:hypothetical protein [Streptomyces sp. Mo3]|uniref:hypothetical protein n=1 Tax=Streptomyces sp. Mo3 TaxID=3161190 RepID=UPI0039EE8B7E|nr:hypothetical protein OG546_34895 [Streptomyces antimycoticus]